MDIVQKCLLDIQKGYRSCLPMSFLFFSLFCMAFSLKVQFLGGEAQRCIFARCMHVAASNSLQAAQWQMLFCIIHDHG